MKIVDYSVHLIKVPYKRVVHWGSTSDDGARFVVLKLISDSGHVGVAEATTKPLWSGVTPASLKVALEEIFMPLITAADLDDELSIDRAIGAIPDNRAAKGLIHTAFWDLRAAIAGKPLWEQWHGVDVIPMSWTLSRQSPKAMAVEANSMVQAYGFRTLKMKGGQGPEVDFLALSEIRQAVGAAIDIYVDVNEYYDRAASISYVRGLAERGVKLVEDPYFMQPDDEFRSFQNQSPIPILVDTHCTVSTDALAFFAHGARAISLKPGRLGMTEAIRCAEIADRHQAKTVIGMFAESDLGTLTNAQLAATRAKNENGLPAEFSFFLMMRESLLTTPLQVQDGNLHIPEMTSISQLVDWTQIRKVTLN